MDLSSVLAPVEAALDAISIEPGAMADDGIRATLLHAERLGARLRACQALLIDEVDRRELARRDGCASPAAWLSAELGISSGEAARRQVEAAAVAASPDVSLAFQRGEITPEHARTIGSTASTEPGIDPGRLLAEARMLDAGRFARRAARLRRAHHADGGLSQFESQRRARSCSVRVRPDDGMVVVHAELDPLTGARVRAALFSEADRCWRAEHGDAAEQVPLDARTHPQRLADALANVFGRPPTAGSPPETVEVLVTIPLDELVIDDGTAVPGRSRCSTHGGAEVMGVGPIPAATARRVACEAGIIPAVLGGASEVLDLGRSRRLANRAQRRALRRRHRTCSVAGCTTPFEWCQIHHLIPWAEGGRTDLDLLAPVCSTHHHLLHEGGWRAERRTGGTLALVPPGERRGHGPAADSAQVRCQTAAGPARRVGDDDGRQR